MTFRRTTGKKRFAVRQRLGMVLVVILAVIVLLTIAVLAFFSHAVSERQIESSRTTRVEAEILGRSAQDYLTELFLREITDPANSRTNVVGGVTLYSPLAPTNALVRRTISSALSLADTNFFNLVRQSLPDIDPNASTHSTAEAARNGRIIGTDRWNSPRLLGPPGFSLTNQLPAWIYVTRSGGITNAPTSDVIGRFAYHVYDLGGLLDVSVAGYPASVTNASALKGTLAGADLTRLPGVSATAINDLVTFRNRLVSPSDATYRDAVQGLARRGFLTLTAPEDQGGTATNLAFLGRQDLLRYVRLQNPALTNVLPFLTHFSRTVNAPSWSPPAAPVSSNPDPHAIRHTTSGTVEHYTDSGIRDDYEIRVGDPLLQRRFSLAKLAWLTCKGPSAELASGDTYFHPGGTAAAIQACFGLQWDGSAERWNYVGPAGSAVRESIATLDEIALEPTPREPNFFEMLRAGILDATLGAAALGKTFTPGNILMTACPPENNLVDASVDLHILKIGANIIDSADPDNFPTILALQFGTTTIERAGTEDLPYLYCVSTGNSRIIEQLGAVVDGKTHRLTESDIVWVPEFFNPHQPSGATDGPPEIRVDFSSGNLMRVGYAANGNSLNFEPVDLLPKSLVSLPAITMGEGEFAHFRDTPQPFRSGTAANNLGNTVPFIDSDVQDIVAFRLFSYGDREAAMLPLLLQADGKTCVVAVQDVILRLQYQTPAGNYKTYSVLGGYEALPGDTGVNGCYRNDFEFNVLKHSDILSNLRTITDLRSPNLMGVDPRSSRFGPSVGQYRRRPGTPPSTTYISSDYLVVRFFMPKQLTERVTGILPERLDLFEDSDGQSRLPDAGLSNTANPYRNLNDMARRPVILQRPFQTVAELGYVFRDTPWQTLNFFRQNTGDAALLDLFSVTDQPRITAGLTSLNTLHTPVRDALLARTAQASDGTLPLTNAETVSIAIGTHLSSGGLPTENTLQNVADLPGMVEEALGGSGLSPIKWQHEAVVRGLAASQSRTWNLLADVICQSGRFSGATEAGNFVVEGENRSWTSLAIDCYTGRVVDLAVENVNE